MDINWTDETGKKHVQKNYPLGRIYSLSFFPDGQSLVASHAYWMVFWDPATGKEIRRQGRYSAGKASIHPDGKSLLVGGDMNSRENMLSFLDAKTGKPQRVFDGHQSSVQDVAFSPDGHYIATCEEGPSEEVRIWEKATGRVVFQGAYKHRGWAEVLAFSPKGDVLAAGHVHEIVLWDWKNAKQLRTFPGKFPIGLAFAADGTKLASCDRDGTIRVRDWRTGKDLQIISAPTKAATSIVAFSPDLSLAAFTDHQQSTIYLWDLAKGKEWKRLEGESSAHLAFSANGRILLQTGYGTMNLWDIASGEKSPDRLHSASSRWFRGHVAGWPLDRYCRC